MGMMAIKFTSEALHSSGLDPIMKAHLDGALRAVVHDLGGMERILRCPMPFGYTTHNRLMILLWCFALPLCLIEVVGVASIPVAFLVSYLIIGEEDVAAEIENPFGVDANDLDEAEGQGEAPKQDHQPVVGGVAEGHGAH